MRKSAFCLLVIIAALTTIWAAAAIFFDLPFPGLRVPVAAAYILLIAVALVRNRLTGKTVAVWAVSLLMVIGWWLTLKPTNDRNWQRDVDRVPWADVTGDTAVIHNIRNFDYVTETSFTPRWQDRTVEISNVRGVDLFVSHWGSPWIAHVIVSFSFADGTHLAASIEARKAVGQEYSAIRGFFRQYEVLYLIAEERDVVGVRTDFRGESVSLYRTLTKPADAQNLFRKYLEWMNNARFHPEWYNALTRNCVTNFVGYLAQSKVGGVTKWDWRTLLDGRGDEMLYDLGDLAGNLPFAELQRRALISASSPTDVSSQQFSREIRAGRPGF